jgi:hypothetical protein
MTPILPPDSKELAAQRRKMRAKVRKTLAEKLGRKPTTKEVDDCIRRAVFNIVGYFGVRLLSAVFFGSSILPPPKKSKNRRKNNEQHSSNTSKIQ